MENKPDEKLLLEKLAFDAVMESYMEFFGGET